MPSSIYPSFYYHFACLNSDKTNEMSILNFKCDKMIQALTHYQETGGGSISLLHLLLPFIPHPHPHPSFVKLRPSTTSRLALVYYAVTCSFLH